MKKIETKEQVNEIFSLFSPTTIDKKTFSGDFYTDDIYVRFYLGDVTNPLVIAFSNAGSVTDYNNLEDPNYSPWGYDFIRKQGFNVISISCYKNNNWYRNPLTIEIIKLISIYISPYETKLGYGSSMGGYAIGAYCDLLNLDRCFLFCPISTLNSDIVSSEEKHSASIQDWTTEYNDGAETLTPKYIFFDPLLKRDKMHAHRYKNSKLLHFRGVGHGMPIHALAVNVLKDCFNVLLIDRLPSSDFYQKIRNGKREYSRYFQFINSRKNSYLTERRSAVIECYYEKYKQNLSPEDYLKTVSQDKKLKLLIDNKDINFIRDLAVSYEKIDLFKAYKLMEIAYRSRPQGTFIKEKFIEYKIKIKDK